MENKEFLPDFMSSIDSIHIFGGSSWNIIDSDPIENGSTLLFVLNIKDSSLKPIIGDCLDELPICSYINCDIWTEEQIYKINMDKKEIKLIHRKQNDFFILPPEDRLPNPLPEKRFSLVETNTIKNESYQEEFLDQCLGGKNFLRFFGKPIWMRNSENTVCNTCKRDMIFIACIGYENWNSSYKLIENEPFFIGEGILYAFFCKNCLELKIISQS